MNTMFKGQYLTFIFWVKVWTSRLLCLHTKFQPHSFAEVGSSMYKHGLLTLHTYKALDKVLWLHLYPVCVLLTWKVM